MKTIIFSFVCIITGFFIATISSHSVTAVEVIYKDIPETVEEWIAYYAHKYNINEQELSSVINCESSYNVVAKGDGGRAWSLAQFHKPTFDSWKKKMGEPHLNYHNFQHQLKLMSWAFQQGESYKDDWTCWTKLYK